MKQKPVITISRTYGSGGREIGQKLALALSVPFYDRKLIEIAADELGVHASVVEQLDETLNRRAALRTPDNMSIATKDMVLHQEDAIRHAAAEPCVIVGRCADYVLRDRPNVVKIYVYARPETRREHAIREHGVDPKDVDALIRKTDKERAAYYNYYTDYTWGDISQYDLCINTSNVSLDAAVRIVCAYVEQLGE